MCYDLKPQISTFIVEIDVFEKQKEMVDYNTVVIIDDFRKEMFCIVLGFIYLFLISNPYTSDFGLS